VWRKPAHTQKCADAVDSDYLSMIAAGADKIVNPQLVFGARTPIHVLAASGSENPRQRRTEWQLVPLPALPSGFPEPFSTGGRSATAAELYTPLLLLRHFGVRRKSLSELARAPRERPDSWLVVPHITSRKCPYCGRFGAFQRSVGTMNGARYPRSVSPSSLLASSSSITRSVSGSKRRLRPSL